MNGGINYLDALLSAKHSIQDEGTELTAAAALNFVGAGVTATYDGANDRIDITIPTAPTQYWARVATTVFPATLGDSVGVRDGSGGTAVRFDFSSSYILNGPLVVGDDNTHTPGSAAIGSIVSVTTASGATRGLISYSYSTANNGARVHLFRARNSIASPVVVASTDTLGAVRFGGYDGASFVDGATIVATVAGTVATGIVPTKLEFQTASTGAPVTRLTIDPVGTKTSNTDAFAADGAQHVSSLWYVASGTLPVMMHAGIGSAPHNVYVGTDIALTNSVFGETTGNSLHVIGGNGLNCWSHGLGASGGPALSFRATGGSRGTPTQVGASDILGGIEARGYETATPSMTIGLQMAFQVDGTVGSGIVPTKLVLANCKPAGGLVTRWTLRADGTQTWFADAGASLTWTIGANPPNLYLASIGATYVGSATTLSEDAGSLIGVSTTTGAARGVISYQHSANANGAVVLLRKSRGTRESLGAVTNTPDTLGEIQFSGWIGATSAWKTYGKIVAVTDGTVTDGTATLPTAVAVQTGTTSAVTRTTWASTGAQNNNCDTGGTYTWNVNSAPKVVFSATAENLQQSSNDAAGMALLFLKDRGGTPAVQIGDTLGSVQFYGHDGTGLQLRGRILAQIDATVSTGTVPTDILVQTGGATLTTRTLWSSIGTQTHTIDSGGSATWTIGGVQVVSLSVSTDAFLAFSATNTTWVTPGSVSTGTGGAANYKAGDHTGTGATNTAGAVTLQGGGATGSSTNAHTGGFARVNGGDCPTANAAGTFLGGAVTIRGGDVTGASGTRTGGDVFIRAGTGGTANGFLRLRDNVTDRIVINATGIGIFGATPVAQPSGTGETVGFTAGGGTTVTDASTFTGNVGTKAYRISDVVKALKNLGAMAAS